MYTWNPKVKCCVIGTDGFWDMVSPQETLDFLKISNNNLMVNYILIEIEFLCFLMQIFYLKNLFLIF